MSKTLLISAVITLLSTSALAKAEGLGYSLIGLYPMGGVCCTDEEVTISWDVGYGRSTGKPVQIKLRHGYDEYIAGFDRELVYDGLTLSFTSTFHENKHQSFIVTLTSAFSGSQDFYEKVLISKISRTKKKVLRTTAVKHLIKRYKKRRSLDVVCAAGSSVNNSVLKQLDRQLTGKRYTGRKRSSRWMCDLSWFRKNIKCRYWSAIYYLGASQSATRTRYFVKRKTPLSTVKYC